MDQPEPDPSAGSDELVAAIVALARAKGLALTAEQVDDLLWEAGLADAIEDLALARKVIETGDSFHPLARFFVEGSAEREFIERVLRQHPS